MYEKNYCHNSNPVQGMKRSFKGEGLEVDAYLQKCTDSKGSEKKEEKIYSNKSMYRYKAQMENSLLYIIVLG